MYLVVSYKKNIKQIIAIIILSIYFLSCTKQHITDTIIFGACKGDILTDSLAIGAKLVGKWTWTEKYCPCCPGVKPTKATKNVIATFNTDSTFSVAENLVIINTGKWSLQKKENLFFITLTKQGTGDYLDGFITLCDNQLLADMSPLDGCKHLFIKAN